MLKREPVRAVRLRQDGLEEERMALKREEERGHEYCGARKSMPSCWEGG